MMRGSSREAHTFAKVLACSLALLLALALAAVPTAALAEDESGQQESVESDADPSLYDQARADSLRSEQTDDDSSAVGQGQGDGAGMEDAESSAGDDTALSPMSTSIPSSVFLRQDSTVTCTLCSSAMMLRARMYLSGNNSWGSVTEAGIRGSAWSSNGLKWSWSYSISGCSMNVSHSKVSGISVGALQGLLNSHPEGVVLYDYSSDYSKAHAVLVTDYEGSTFYCADPASGYSGSRMALSSSYLGRLFGGQASILSSAKGYWYVSSYSIPSTHTHSWVVDHYEYYNDVNHTVVYRCSSCGETKVEREGHTFKWVGGDRVACVCTSCGTEETFTDDGGKGYVTKSETNLYGGDNSGSSVLATIPGGTLLHPAEVTLGSWGRYVGKVSYGGQTGYVVISDCYMNNTAGIHTFVGGVCTECGTMQVGSAPGRYRFARDGTGFYGAPFSADAKSFSTGDEVIVVKVDRTSSGYLWGWLSDGCLVDMQDLAYPAVDGNWQNGSQVSIGVGPFVIAPVANTGVCLDVEGGSAASGTNVRLYEWNDTPSQQFTFAPSGDGDGTYVVKSALGDVVLDVTGGSHADGTNVWTCTPNGTPAQKWYVERTPDGYYSLRSSVNNLYLDYEGEAAQLSNLRVMHGSGGASQKFLLIPVSCTVAFESNGGTAVSPVSVRPRTATQAPPDPTRSGYTFGGWYSDQGLTTAYDFSAPVLGDLTLYARWSEVEDSVARLWGQGALDTMSSIVGAGSFAAGGTVVLATSAGYWDALTAAGVAGLAGAPVLLTDGSSLSPQTASLLARLRPATVVVCGGTLAVSDATAGEAADAAGTSPRVVRCAGQTATGTACQIFSRASSDLGYSWSDTAVVATNDGYWDALAAAPYAYARHAPIFLAEGHSSLSEETLDAMASGGVTKVYIVGGELAVSRAVEGQLAERGIEVVGRLAGDNAVMTSAAIAEFEVSQGMSADGMGVATVDGYWDALTGAALCGSEGSVLVLASDSDRRAIDAVAAPSVSRAYVFGGEMAVSDSTLRYLEGAIR